MCGLFGGLAVGKSSLIKVRQPQAAEMSSTHTPLPGASCLASCSFLLHARQSALGLPLLHGCLSCRMHGASDLSGGHSDSMLHPALGLFEDSHAAIAVVLCVLLLPCRRWRGVTIMSSCTAC